ncbi:F0F1 ATP synthase subunit B [Flavobacteriaceae bacterium]|jgi:F-type H+-transporting ATPase subunit b|nr:F0F1 ATP synthase subunit B [Flavobacteriaceae bacterium]MDA8904375.1 F0F1 ATP synthase subunit B [Flavobacteriaceae bacterium]MDA9067212.1 F0F1 ATP synthase subunit B [Flavobacteriaceae bacterium]MDB4133603.1 F0F1 ATP synthase subunit B [Flavobacteriaceae bacterium]MDB4212650.1 F0F1 ATP synthase subunit B [Flavobacteriaceae bacterium]|tara:strand:+ start:283 stop:780 length:498 start_codon:yes stop_codon:yes gene_type:complete
MDLVTPDVGLLFWTFCSFVILYFLLKKFAWKPILGTVNDREASIREALLAAENAKKEMENLKSDNEKILKEAKIERENMLKDAREIKTKLIADAENQAKEQASKLIESAQLAIQNEKNSAMSELKQTVVELSVGIAEKVISSELDDKNKQLKVVENMLNDASLNN